MVETRDAEEAHHGKEAQHKTHCFLLRTGSAGFSSSSRGWKKFPVPLIRSSSFLVGSAGKCARFAW